MKRLHRLDARCAQADVGAAVGSAGVMARRSLSQNSGYFLPKPMVPGRTTSFP